MKAYAPTAHEIELSRKNGTLEQMKSRLVESMIATRYTVGQQIAILRQKAEKPDEYEAFFSFAEECKARARAMLEE
jgi:hypothetical protein